MKYVVCAIKIIDKISETVGKFASTFIIITLALQIGEVVMRYFIGRSTVWTWEVSTHLYGANFMLAAAWALKEGKHVRTDILYSRLSPKVKAILDLCTFSTFFLLFVVFLSFFTIRSAAFSVSIWESSHTMTWVPIWPLRISIAVGFSLLLLQGLAKIARDVIFLVKGETV